MFRFRSGRRFGPCRTTAIPVTQLHPWCAGLPRGACFRCSRSSPRRVAVVGAFGVLFGAPPASLTVPVGSPDRPPRVVGDVPRLPRCGVGLRCPRGWDNTVPPFDSPTLPALSPRAVGRVDPGVLFPLPELSPPLPGGGDRRPIRLGRVPRQFVVGVPQSPGHAPTRNPRNHAVLVVRVPVSRACPECVPGIGGSCVSPCPPCLLRRHGGHGERHPRHGARFECVARVLRAGTVVGDGPRGGGAADWPAIHRSHHGASSLPRKVVTKVIPRASCTSGERRDGPPHRRIHRRRGWEPHRS